MAPTTIITITTITTTTITTNPTSTTANTNSNTTTSAFTVYITKPFCISAISLQCLVLLCTTRGSTPPSTSHWVCQSSSTASWTEIFRPNSFSKTQRYAFHTFIDTYARHWIIPNIIHANTRAFIHTDLLYEPKGHLSEATFPRNVDHECNRVCSNHLPAELLHCISHLHGMYKCTYLCMYVCMHACALLYDRT
jgi:hypothetical protein